MGNRNPKTSGMSKFLIVRPVDNNNNVSVEDQKIFWSSVGMLQNLVKHSRPNIANVTWKMSKGNDRVIEVAFCEMYNVIKYVLDTKNLELKIESTEAEKDP